MLQQRALANLFFPTPALPPRGHPLPNALAAALACFNLVAARGVLLDPAMM
jgi:hypothetical protein